MADKFKIKTLDDYRKQLNTTSPLTLPKSSNVTTTETLKTQRDNLQKRLKGVGVDPDNLRESEVDNRGFVEKALNLKPDQNWFFDFLEVIDRPIRGAMAGVQALVEGEDPIGEFMDSFRGIDREEVMFTDVLDSAGLIDKDSMPGLATFAVDMGGEVFLDPLNLIPAGFLRKALGLSARSSLELVDIPTSFSAVDEVSQPLLQRVTRLDNFLKNANSNLGYVDDTTKIRIFTQEGLDVARKNSVDRIKQIVNNPSAATAGEIQEAIGQDILRAKLQKEIPDLEVIRFRANDAGTPDVAFFKKVLGADNKVYWLEIGNIEIKGIQDLAKGVSEVRFLGTRVSLNSATNGDEFIDLTFSDRILEEVSGTLLYDLKQAFNLPDGAFYQRQAVKDAAGNVVKRKGKTVYENVPITLQSFMEDVRKASAVLEPITKGKNGTGGFLNKIRKTLSFQFKTDSINNLISSPDYSTIPKVRDQLEKLLRKANKAFDEDVVDEMAREIYKLRNKYKDGIKAAGIGDFKVTYNVDLQKQQDFIRNTLKNILRDKFKNNPYIVYLDKFKNSKILKTSDVIDTLDITKSTFRKVGKDKYRIEVFLGSTDAGRTLDGFNLKDATQDFIKYLIDNNENLKNLVDPIVDAAPAATKKALVEVAQPSRVMEFLSTKAIDEKSILQKPARFATDMIEKLKYKFDLAAGFTRPFKGQISRIQGEQAFKLDEYVTRLNGVEKTLKQIDPSAGEYVRKLLELGVTPDEIRKGLRRTYTKTMDTQSLLNYYFRQTAGGRLTIMDSFATDVAKKNAEESLNQIFKFYDLDAEAVIKSTSDGIGNVLEIKTDLPIEDLKRMIGKNPIIDKRYLNISYGEFEVDKGLREFVDIYKDEFTKVIDLHADISELIIREIGVENLPEGVIKELGYYRHTLTTDAKKALRETAPAARSKFTKEGSNIFAPRMYEASADAVNSAVKDFLDLDYDLISSDGFASMRDMIESALIVEEQNKVLGAILQESVALDTAGAPRSFFEVIDNTKEAANDLGPSYVVISDGLEVEFGKMFDNLNEASMKEWKGFMQQMGFKEGKAIAINKSVYETLKGINNAYVEVNEFWKYYDSFLNFWKSTTLISPGFHMRNFFGNATNMYIAGMSTPDIFKYQTKALTDFNTYLKYRDVVASEGIEAVPEAFREGFKNVKAYYDGGLAQTRKGLRDLEKIESLALKGYDPTKKGAKQVYESIVKANFHAAEYLDDFQRYAMYNWALSKNEFFPDIAKLNKQGATKEIIDKYRHSVARQKVMDALFDYTNLTSFEKDYVKRLFPFYTFMKNNIIFQLKSTLDSPQRLRRVVKSIDLANQEISGITEDQLPDYARDNLWLAIPFEVTQDDEEAISFLKLNLPPTDFAEFVEQPFQRGVASLAAPFKLPIEYGFMRDSFTGREFEQYPGEKNQLEDETGIASFLRDERGTVAVSTNPVIQKLMNEAGLRVPQNYLSIAFDIADGIMGYQSGQETFTDTLGRLSLTGTQATSNLELTKLYQDLEKLRNLRSFYEQETGLDLPSLDDLGIGN